MMLFVLGQLALASAFTTAIYLLVPRLALGGVLFGVTVADGFAASAEGRAIVRRFRAHVVAAGVLGLAGLAAAVAAGSAGAGGVAVVVQAVFCTAAWLAARARTRPHAVPPSAVRRAALAPEPAAIAPMLEALPFLVLAAAAVVLALAWDRIPPRFPVHWGLSGPDRFAERTPVGVFAPLVTGAVMCAGLLALRAAIAAFSPTRVGDARAAALRRLLRVSLLGTGVFLGVVFAAVALSPLGGGPWPVLVVSAAGVLALLVAIAVAATRIAALPAAGGDGTPDDRWKLGLFYVNPDDPAVFVPKRAGLGYTVNLGRPAGVLTLAAVIAIPVALALVSALAAR